MWNETTLIFTPDQGYLDEFATYTVTIGTGARGAHGETLLGKPYSWAFSTARMLRVATFGYGPNAQVVDADGRRAVQFVVSAEDTPTVTVSLYRLTLEQFLDRYASASGRGVGIQPPHQHRRTTPVKQWSPELQPYFRGFTINRYFTSDWMRRILSTVFNGIYGHFPFNPFNPLRLFSGGKCRQRGRP
jgi:hypothetical protein